MSIYDFKLEDNRGRIVALEEFRGKVLLIVNTATRCGFTPQYRALEELYQASGRRGWKFWTFPVTSFWGRRRKTMRV